MSWKLSNRLAFSAALSLITPALSMAKPPDLPVDQKVHYADSAPEAPASPQAEALFEKAERSRQAGQLTEARRGYQEVHLMSPASRVGRQAIQRLHDLENPGNDFFEEQEPPLLRINDVPGSQPARFVNTLKPSFREYLEMLRITKPLDTVTPQREDY